MTLRCLHLIWVFVGMIGAHAVSGGDTKVYKSSSLGFSVEYPQSWIPRPHAVCGNTYLGLSKAEWRRAPIYPVRFWLSDARRESIYVVFFRELGDDLPAYVSQPPGVVRYQLDDKTEITETAKDFNFGSGRLGKKWCRDKAWISKEEQDAGTYVRYVRVDKGRRIELRGLIRTDRYKTLEATLDRMARSIDLFDPIPKAAGPPGTFATFECALYSFEYPADWWIARPYDDSKMIELGVQIYLSIVAPKSRNTRWADGGTSIACGQYPPDPKARVTLDEYLARVERDLAGVKAIDIQHAWYRTNHGQYGIKLWFLHPKGRKKTVTFALPTANGRVQCLSYNCTKWEYEKLKPIIERSGMSFRTTAE